MSVWVVEAEIALLLFVIALPMAIGPMVYLHYRRYGTFRVWPAVLTVGALLYALGLVAFTLFPLPDTNDAFCTLREDVSFWQLRPLASLDDVAAVMGEVGVVDALTSGVFLQVAFNVLLLLPLGVYAAYRWRRGFAFTAALGLGTSLLIELTQGTGVWRLYGCPYRLADVDDLMTNTLGAMIGWMIGTALIRILPDPNPEASPDLGPPSISRRAAAFMLDVLYFLLFGALLQILYLIAIGGDVDGPGSAIIAVTSIASGVLLTLAVPVLRRDRATPGQISTWLGVAQVGTTSPAPRSRIAVRWGVRWGPILIVGLVQPLFALAAVIAVELTAVVLRRDDQSLSGIASATHTITRQAMRFEPTPEPSPHASNDAHNP